MLRCEISFCSNYSLTDSINPCFTSSIKIEETTMLTMTLWLCLYALLIFWSFEAFYVMWRFYRNDAWPRFRRKASRP